MKIVHLCLSAFFIDNYSYQENILPKYHVKFGHSVTVIASLFSFNGKGEGYYMDGYTEYDDKNGFHVIRLPYKFPQKVNRTLRHYEGFSEVLEKEAPDLIFSHNVSYGDITVLIKYLKKHPEVKVYADNHADYINSAKNFASKKILHPIIWRYYAKKLEPYLEKCFGVTPMRCRFLTDMYHINPNKVDYLPMGVDDDSIPKDRQKVFERIRNELNIPLDDKVIITGGKIDRLKNTDILVSAFQSIGDSHMHLIVCGTFTEEMSSLEEAIKNIPQIHYMGWCDANRVIDCMLASDMACFPGTHSTLWEQSVGLGLPAIFKLWHEMEHVNINDNCIFVKGDDTKELELSIKKIFTKYNEFRAASSIAAQSFLYSNISRRAIGQ